jgi:hypothetical protein
MFVGLAGFDVGFQLQAIVVGGSSDEFVRIASGLLDSYSLAIIRCPDVYSSVPRLHEGPGGVVVGRFEELRKEDGRFFDIARAYGFACCCFVDEAFAGNRREIFKAMERGVFIVTKAEEIEEILAGLSGSGNAREPKVRNKGERGLVGNVVEKILGGTTPQRSKPRAKSGFSKDEFSMTQAELDALLGA